jgi:RNA polymerase sigma factor (sigma-70 family)
MKEASSPSGKSRLVLAMVVGTALSTLGSGPAVAAQDSTRAISDLSRYCTACWRNARLHPDCWPDCTQEVLCRLLERVPVQAWQEVLKQDEGNERREFLRAIDTVKKRTQRSRKLSSVAGDAVADNRDGHDRRLADDWDAVHQSAGRLLSPRQQRILRLSSQGWTAKDIAEQMQLPPERVSDEKYKAIRKLREHLSPIA